MKEISLLKSKPIRLLWNLNLFMKGTLLHIGIHEGETAEVDTLLAIIGEEGEDISQLLVPVNNSVQLDLVDQINETESSIEEVNLKLILRLK